MAFSGVMASTILESIKLNSSLNSIKKSFYFNQVMMSHCRTKEPGTIPYKFIFYKLQNGDRAEKNTFRSKI